MGMMVQASTDQAPELLDLIERRRALGLDTHDEIREGVYRVMPDPSPEHSRLAGKLFQLLDERADAQGLWALTTFNIGDAKRDYRVPDLGVCRPDTERTSPAFLATAELVVEILSPGDAAGEKLPFYANHGVREYLEIDLAARTARLLAARGPVGGEPWAPTAASTVIALSLTDVEAVVSATLD